MYTSPCNQAYTFTENQLYKYELVVLSCNSHEIVGPPGMVGHVVDGAEEGSSAHILHHVHLTIKFEP